MTKSQKQQNVFFFKSVISSTKEGGMYLYPAIFETFTVKGGKMYGTSKGVKAIKDITTSKFHSSVLIKE
jgi:hypothetical protein